MSCASPGVKKNEKKQGVQWPLEKKMFLFVFFFYVPTKLTIGNAFTKINLSKSDRKAVGKTRRAKIQRSPMVPVSDLVGSHVKMLQQHIIH